MISCVSLLIEKKLLYALIRVLDVRRVMDKRCIIIAIFFDFTKAFDNVCHVRLINKFRLGFASCSLALFISDLQKSGRAWSCGLLSSDRFVLKGVPQVHLYLDRFFFLYLKDFGKALQRCYNFYAHLLIYIHATC